MEIPGGSFHGQDHVLFDKDFRPIDWEAPYWALKCGLPATMFRKQIRRPKKLNGTALVLSAPGAGDNIWHFFVDSMSKIKVLKNAGIELDGFDYILINSLRMPYALDALTQIGIDQKKLIETEIDSLVSADKLTCVTLGCLFPPDPWVLKWLRAAFLPKETNSSPYRKIFVSRAGASRRRLIREHLITDQLKQNGFEVVQLETLSLAKQIKLFSQAKAVVASHGAGLTNLTWCPAGTRVVELFAPEYVTACYWNLSCMLELKYSFAMGRPTLPEPKFGRAVLNMERLGADQNFEEPDRLIQKILEFTTAQ